MKTYRIGLLGAGFMGRTHTYCWRNLHSFYDDLPFKIQLKAVATSREESAVEAKEKLGYEKWYSSCDELIADKDIDIIDIASPNSAHYNALLKAAKESKTVYCDKPLTGNLGEAQKLASHFEDLDRAGQMTLQYRFYPATMRARSLIEQGSLGDIISFRAVYLHSGNITPKKPVNFKDLRREGGGVLFDMGTHVMDLITWLCNDSPKQLFAMQKILNTRRPSKNDPSRDIEQDGDDMTIISMLLASGALGTIEASKIATGTQDDLRFEIHGTRGALRFSLMEPNYLDFFDASQPDMPLGGTCGFTRIHCTNRYGPPVAFPSPKASIGWLRGHLHCLYSFVMACHNSQAFEPSLRRGLYLEKLLAAVQESADTGGIVNVT